MALIEFKDATILNGENKVVYNFNMTVEKGDFVYIVGKVGTGKTSIIRTMIAENRLGGGKASVCGHELSAIKDKDIPPLRRKTGVVFQDFQLLMDRSVEENLAFVLRCTGWKNENNILQRINQVLKAVKLEDKSHKMPHQLSGGEQQRVAIARAILNSPELLLADEPTGNLDEDTARGIMQLLTDLRKERGMAIVMVTHNRSLVENFPGRVFMCGGERCLEITANEYED